MSGSDRFQCPQGSLGRPERTWLWLLVVVLVEGTILSWFCSTVLAATVDIRQVKCWDDGRKTTRVTVDVTRTPKWNTNVYTSPARVLIQMENCRLDSKLKQQVGKDSKVVFDFDLGMVQKVELWEAKRDTVYLYVYLDKAITPESYTKGGRLCLDFHRPPKLRALPESPRSIRSRKSVLTKMIVIDPGHGGEDPGCCGLWKLNEKDIVLNVAKMVANYMNDAQNTAFHSYLTRDRDFCPSLERRVDFTNDLAEKGGADCFISIHCNASRHRAAYGVEIFRLSRSLVLEESHDAIKKVGNLPSDFSVRYGREAREMLARLRVEDSDRLGHAMLEHLCRIPGFSRRAEDAKPARFRVLRNLNVPGVLIELGFLTNWTDARKLKDPYYQKQIALKIYDGLKDYFGVELPSPPPPPKMARAESIQNTSSHKVRQGESLWDISQRYGTSVYSIQALNGLRGNLIRENQILQIPTGDLARKTIQKKEAVYLVKPGDNLYSISQRYGVSLKQLKSANNINSKGLIHPGDFLLIPER